MTGDVRIECFTESLFGENAYVVTVDGHTGAWVIDPSFPPACDRMCDFVERQGCTVEAVVLTHGHADHIAGVDRVMARFADAGLLISAEDQVMLTNVQANLSAPFGLEILVASKPTATLAAGAELTLGTAHWQVLDTSGHSPGGRSLYCERARVVFTGDALFSKSVGRCDLPGSDMRQLVTNIRRHLLTLPDDTRIYSGHGPATTVEKERRFNPYVADDSDAA